MSAGIPRATPPTRAQSAWRMRPVAGGAARAGPLPAPLARPALSIVLPACDEEQNIGVVVARALEVAARHAPSFEIVVVNDGSRDGTAAAIERARRGDSRIRLVEHGSNRGYGAALRSGLREARGQLVFFTDSDLQFDLAELPRLLQHIPHADIVAGYRAPRRDPLPRRLIAAAWGTLVRALFGLRVRDIDCAFKVFHRRVIEAMPIASLGAFVNTEILVRSARAGYRVRQIPVSHRPRRHGRQSGARPRVVLRALFELLSLYRELHRLPPPVAARAAVPVLPASASRDPA